MLLCLGVNTCGSVQLLNCSVSELLSVRGIRIRLFLLQIGGLRCGCKYSICARQDKYVYTLGVYPPKIKIWHGRGVRKHSPAGQSIGQISPPPPLTEGS